MPPTENDLNESIEPSPISTQPIPPKTKKIYRFSDVRNGSIIGGPWASAYFFYTNFKNTNNPKLAKIALLLGALTPILFIILGSIIFVNVPQYIFIGLYVGLVTWLTYRYQTKLVKNYEETGGLFYSSSRAAVAALTLAVLYIAVLFGGIYSYEKVRNPNSTLGDAMSILLISDKFDSKAYDAKLAKVKSNDSDAGSEFSRLSQQSPTSQDVVAAANNAILKHTENKQIISEMSSLEGLPSVLKKQVDGLTTYTKLKLEIMDLIKKAALENTDKYDSKINEINEKINDLPVTEN